MFEKPTAGAQIIQSPIRLSLDEPGNGKLLGESIVSVLKLQRNKGITQEIRWDGSETITIPQQASRPVIVDIDNSKGKITITPGNLEAAQAVLDGCCSAGKTAVAINSNNEETVNLLKNYACSKDMTITEPGISPRKSF